MKIKINSKLAIVVLVAILISAFFAFDLGEYLTLEYMQSQRQQFIEQGGLQPAPGINGPLNDQGRGGSSFIH